MLNYNEFPPLKYFTRVLKSCPKSAFLYVQLWEKKDKNMLLRAQKKDIRKEYLISTTMFRNMLVPLTNLNLIHFDESDEKFKIDVFGPNVND